MRTIARSLADKAIVGDPVAIPWPKLQDALRLHTKELAIVAGAPGAGKSVFALNLAVNTNEPVLYLAQDSSPSVYARVAALLLRGTINWVFDSLRDDDDREDIIEQLDGQMENLFINAGALTIDGDGGIEQRIIALKEFLGKAPQLVIIDNLIDLIVPGHVHTEQSFYAASLNPLKQMAIRHNTCILALHHVTRSGDERHGLGTKPLKMTDLLYSGEREAEHVLGVFHNQGAKTMNVQILKQRDGEADAEGNLYVPLTWHAAHGRLDRR